MNQGNYSTVAQGWPVLDLTNPQAPTYIPAGGHIKSLAPACYRITVKNTITITDATIVVSATALQGGSEPGTCTTPGGATVDPATMAYYNLKATVSATSAQTGVIIEFDYLYDDVPVATGNTITVDIAAPNTPQDIYLFDPNQPLTPDHTVSLYGARVVSY